MRAIITEVKSVEDRVSVSVSYYLINDATEPFLSQVVEMLPDTPKATFKGIIKDRLGKFEDASARVVNIQDWVGWEIK